MRSLVVDASVAIKWLNPAEPLADKANAIRDAYEQGHITLLVPTFWDYEIVNGVNKAVARGDLTEEEGEPAGPGGVLASTPIRCTCVGGCTAAVSGAARMLRARMTRIPMVLHYIVVSSRQLHADLPLSSEAERPS